MRPRVEPMNNPFLQIKQSLQSRLEDVLTSMPVGVSWARVTDGRIQFVNRKFTAMFGYTLDELSTVNEWIRACYAVPEQADKISRFWLAPHEAGAGLEEVELAIRCKDGQVKTVLSSKIMLPDEEWALSTFVDITPRKEEEKLIKQQAMEDPLTGLLNRRAFSQMLEARLGRHDERRPLALLLLDFDGFKQVNDSLGHDKGDLLLRQAAERLRQAMRGGDCLCRIGGDEFAVLVDTAGQAGATERVAERIIREISRPFHLQNIVVALSVSVGVAFHPQDARDEKSLFKVADRALYRAKRDGRGRWSR